ncbi:RNA polymerase sigma-70 factor [Carboxylicivirga sediminis]|nr:RNA polymerase sigma-70 factor [Carboxylicivirga sediminis]
MESDTVIHAINSYLLNHDLKSFKVMYHYYYKSLCFFANDYLSDSDAAQDVVQDVFTQVWDNMPEVSEPSKLQAYLYAMVRNRCLNRIRTQQNLHKYQTNEMQEIAWDDDESVRIVKAEVLREIMASIEKLPERAQEVFKLSYLTQLREQEIADRLNISVNSVKTHKKRAKSILKDELRHLFSLISIFHL